MSARLRPACAAGLVLTVAFTGLASAAVKKAAPKPVCNLLVDDPDDANGSFTGAGGGPSESAVDILSGDIATTRKALTTVLRVKKLATSSPTSPGGLHWKFFFDVNGTQIYTQAVAATGAATTFTFGTIDGTTGTSTSLGDATGVLDMAKNEVRVTVPLGDLPEKPKVGTKIASLEPNAGRFVGNDAVGTFSDPTDEATSDKTYVVDAPSCVPVGK